MGASSFDSDLSSWDVSNVTNMRNMFRIASSFSSDLSSWNVSSVTNMRRMFWGASSFDSDLSSWDTRNVTNTEGMFRSAFSFSSDLSSWNVSSVTNMGRMFWGASSFDSDLSSWNVSSVTDMNFMFSGASSFNGNISNWNVSSVVNMRDMFNGASNFDSDLSSWDVSSVINMLAMFQSASSFDSDLSSWDVSNVTNMESIFQGATSFNAPIGNWDTSQVTNLDNIFSGATSFNQDLRCWVVTNFPTKPVGFDIGAAFENQNNLQPFWGANTDLCSLPTGPVNFIFQIDTTLTNNLTFILPLTPNRNYNFTVNWGDDNFRGIFEWNQSEATHTYDSHGQYTIEIFGIIQGFSFNNSNSAPALINIIEWGNLELGNTTGHLFGTTNLQSITATDLPNLISTTSLENSFRNTGLINYELLNTWNLENITSLASTFQDSINFNTNLNNWNTSNVTNFSSTFNNTQSFNQPLNTWNTQSATRMDFMFNNASQFNQSIGNWDTQNVLNMNSMFNNANSFNQDLRCLNVESIPTQPNNFNTNSLTTLLPHWGTNGASCLIPNSFQFTNLSEQNISEFIFSEQLTITNFTEPLSIQILDNTTLAQFSINSGSWQSSSTTISEDQTLQLRLLFSNQYNQTHNTTLQLGTQTFTWQAQTREQNITPPEFTSINIEVEKNITQVNNNTYFIEINVKNKGNSPTPENAIITIYDFLPNNFNVSGVIQISDVIGGWYWTASSTSTLSAGPFNGTLLRWALNPTGNYNLNASLNKNDGEFNFTNTWSANYTIIGSGEYSVSEVFLVGIDPQRVDGAGSSEKVEINQQLNLASSFERTLGIIAGILIVLGVLI